MQCAFQSIRGAVVAAAAGAFVLATPAHAQRFSRDYQSYEPAVEDLPYSGQFTFARLSFVTGPGGFYYRGMPAWAHGYPDAEFHLLQIMDLLSTVKPRLDHSKVVQMDDPELFKYPVAYMAEADFWVLGDKEVTELRKYLLKGGFIIFDDFRDPGRFGGTGWEGFQETMKRILPQGTIVDLSPKDPIFHSFYEITSFGPEMLPRGYDDGAPVLRGIYQDNDPTKRLMVMINFNTDISDFWEFSGQGRYAVTQSNQGYKLGVNYLVYALSH
ncbi:MAG TPA: DUF4159 domain-containing protein [Gemmatimonadales bacterium]|jgi:hypothetical protein|nr:DUF4159 domain-containing protein [Gemmatimonadales bacterium]